MSRRKWIIVGTLALVLTVASELTFGRLRTSKGCVQIINQSDSPMEDLLVSYNGTDVAIKRVASNQSVNVWFTAGDRGLLSLDYQQKNNPVAGFIVPDYDPIQNRRDGFKLSLVVKNDRIERSVEDDESTTAMQTFIDRFKGWLSSQFMSAP